MVSVEDECFDVINKITFPLEFTQYDPNPVNEVFRGSLTSDVAECVCDHFNKYTLYFASIGRDKGKYSVKVWRDK